MCFVLMISPPFSFISLNNSSVLLLTSPQSTSQPHLPNQRKHQRSVPKVPANLLAHSRVLFLDHPHQQPHHAQHVPLIPTPPRQHTDHRLQDLLLAALATGPVIRLLHGEKHRLVAQRLVQLAEHPVGGVPDHDLAVAQLADETRDEGAEKLAQGRAQLGDEVAQNL
jgi:hypothetical protein